jgi:hypothetical protein
MTKNGYNYLVTNILPHACEFKASVMLTKDTKEVACGYEEEEAEQNT